MDYEAVWLSDETDLNSLGLKEKGHIIALKSFCFPKSDLSKEELASKVKATGEERVSAKRRKSSKEKVVSIGWKNYDGRANKYVIVRADKGGGTRELLLPKSSTYDDMLQKCQDVYFPEGKSNAGNLNIFDLSLMSFKGTPIDSSFILDEYIKEHHLTKTRIYLYSKKKGKQQIMQDAMGGSASDSDDDLPTFISVMPTIQSLSDDDLPTFISTIPTIRSSSPTTGLIGSSEERLALNNDISHAYEESLQIDREKDNIKRTDVDNQNRKEELRESREHLVPDEPDLFSPHIVVLVRHQQYGIVKRIFPEEVNMSSVYHWIGSLSPNPENFSLCESPDVAILPNRPVAQVKSVLCMQTYEEVEKNGTFLLDNQIISIEDRRKVQLKDLPSAEGFNYVSRSNILEDFLYLYKHHQYITCFQPSILFKEELAVGDGVSKDAISSFYQCFFIKYFDGVDAKVPSMSIGEDMCIIFGRIISHAFISFGIFPVQIAKASLIHYLTGNVSDEDLFESFHLFLDPKEGDLVKRAIHEETMSGAAISDILADYRVNAVVNKENAYKLIVSAAKNLFLRSPCFAFQQICKGMGDFWYKVTPTEINQIYSTTVATPERVIDKCDIDERDKQEAKCATWFCRYVRCCSSEMLGLLLRFCTGSAHLMPSTNIKVTWNSDTGENIRPTAKTCFQIITFSKNHQSFQQFKINTDLYIKSDLWEMNDL